MPQFTKLSNFKERVKSKSKLMKKVHSLRIKAEESCFQEQMKGFLEFRAEIDTKLKKIILKQK